MKRIIFINPTLVNHLLIFSEIASISTTTTPANYETAAGTLHFHEKQYDEKNVYEKALILNLFVMSKATLTLIVRGFWM